MVGQITIIGLGLIGGSLGMVFCQSPLGIRVCGYDVDAGVREQALKMGCVHATGPINEVVAEADFVFICTPISRIPQVVGEIADCCRPGCIISDVGSTKQAIVPLFESLPTGVTGIGGHPMAGSEYQGIMGADRYLFENAVYVLTPGEKCADHDVQRLSSLLGETGAHIIIMDALTHDRIVAAVSHLPHLVAGALVNILYDEVDSLALAAGGFRDTTRVASGSPELWTDILLSNRHLLADRLNRFIDQLQWIKETLNKGDSFELKAFLERARGLRDTLPRQKKGLIPHVQEVICLVPDRPGIIGELGTWLGKEGINIADIEILRVREGDGGTIRLGVGPGEAGPQAVQVLRSQGVKAWQR